MKNRLAHLTGALAALAWSAITLPAAPLFYRGVNLNGPAVQIDGKTWEGKDAAKITIKGSTFENQAVPLKPPTDAGRANMIRSSVWGGNVQIEFSDVPSGKHQIFLYVWEDNHSERFDVLINGKIVQEVHSGSAGMWKRLGPWLAEPHDGKLKVGAKGGAANLSGIEIWSGEGEVPKPQEPQFLTTLAPEHTEFFERRIRPILVDNCYKCHAADAKKIGAGLLLDSRAGVIKGGDTGPAIVPGLPEASLLIQAVQHVSEDLAMPPKKKLRPEEIDALIQWVKMGAPDPRTENTVAVVDAKSAIDWDKAREFWSFRPIQDLAPPAVRQRDWPANSIDYFTLAKMEQAGLSPAPDAEKRALLRRATFDLTGLPPTPKEMEEFLADNSPGAFEKVVNRLLDSPAYGERWGRHWLDVVRYADTAGDNSDYPIPQMYRYRNWVIAAFNRDLPYDEFVRQQLAGDLLPADNTEEKRQKTIATGYIANARRFGSRVDDYPQHLTIEDTIDNVGRAFLGLTVSCARCHDHKFDPVTAQDYYALYGIFHSTRYPWPGIELDKQQRDLVPLVPKEEVERAQALAKDEQKRLDAEVERLDKEVNAAEGDKKKELEKALADAKGAADRHKRKALPVEQAYAVSEGKKIEDVAVQLRGDPAKPGPVVRRRFLTVLGGAELPPDYKGSGRRELAEWIVDKKNPLTARVMANRLWLHHFGRGIVPTPNDFGKQGKPPTHPELLDHLASQFINSGWSIKAMHRLIMNSRTYRLSSAMTAAAIDKDVSNELLTAFPRRRLDAEAIRDAMLALGETLEPAVGGPHPFPEQHDWNFTQHNPFKAVYDTRKRSVYLMTQRIQRHPYLAIFDGADPAASTAFRTTSTTPIQALYLLNEEFVHKQAERFARGILDEASQPNEQVRLAFLRAFGRDAAQDELVEGARFLATVQEKLASKGLPEEKRQTEALQSLARVLFRLNEFVYID